MAFDPFASLTPGTEMVYESHSYFFVRCTPDGRYMAISSAGALLLMPDPDTGLPVFPTVRMLCDAQREAKLFIRSDPLDNPVRAAARAEEKTPKEVIDADPDASLRDRVVRAWDDEPNDAKPMLSDEGLRKWLLTVMPNAEILSLYRRIPAGSTIREWINERGRSGDRRMADMENRSGKVPRKRKLNPTVLVLARLHALAVANRDKQRSIKTGYRCFERDILRVNQGEPIEIDGAIVEYEKPTKKLKACGREIFRLECHRAKKMETYKATWGEKGARAIFRGGGKAKEPTRFLEIVEQDDTPFPKWFLVDLENRVPIGPVTVVATMDVFTRAFLGWDVSFEAPSISSWMRALSHCAMPKAVPKRLQHDYPELADIYGYITGCVLYDNALQNVSKAVEDAGGDLCHEVRLAGEGESTHKSHIERGLKTAQTMMRELPGNTFDIKLMRKYGYDPAVHVVVTVQEFRVLLDEAFATYHITPSDALNGRSPLDVWTEQVRLHGLSQARDVDQFLRSIGDIAYYTFGRSGCEIDNLTYSGGDSSAPGNVTLLADLASALGPSLDADNPRFEVKVKTYPNDIGFISVWNPHARRYVDVPCTRQRYAAGKPKWLHERIKKHAALMREVFSTEEQMLEAQAGFTDVIAAIAPDAKARERKAMAQVLDAPNVRRYLGDSINFIRVKPSPSGLESIVEHDLRSDVRRDHMVKTTRSQRGGANVARDRRDAGKERETAELIAERAKSQRRRPTSPKASAKARGAHARGKPAVTAAVPISAAKFR